MRHQTKIMVARGLFIGAVLFGTLGYLTASASGQEVVGECYRLEVTPPTDFFVTTVADREEIARGFLAAMIASAAYENVSQADMIAEAFALADAFELAGAP